MYSYGYLDIVFDAERRYSTRREAPGRHESVKENHVNARLIAGVSDSQNVTVDRVDVNVGEWIHE